MRTGNESFEVENIQKDSFWKAQADMRTGEWIFWSRKYSKRFILIRSGKHEDKKMNLFEEKNHQMMHSGKTR